MTNPSISPSGSSPSDFVGREAESKALVGALEDAVSGRGGLVLLSGEPGIGKTRLADEFGTGARERGVRVLRGRCWEGAGAPAYWPWVQAIRSLLGEADTEVLADNLGDGGADIAQMLPELHELFPELPSPPSTDPESARFRLFDSTASFLANVARTRPLVTILDDLHAADTPSLLLLRFVAGVLGESRLLVVGTYRDVELTPEHQLTKVVSELGRNPTTRELYLGGLNDDDATAFIRAAAGVEPQAPLVSALRRETGGNPLFLREAVRLLAAEGRLGEIADAGPLRVSVPSRIREVIGRRIGHLSEPCSRALVLGSVLGPEFSLEVLGRLGEFAREELLDLLDEAAREGLLDAAPGALDRFRFSHDLVRETLYEEVSSAERVRLHRRAAEVLEEIHRTDLEPHLAELAHHCFEAARGGDARKAVEYGRRAGEQAAGSLAYEEAARLYQMALQALEVDVPSDAHLEAELLVAAGDARARAGDLARSRDDFLRAATIARRVGGAGLMARAALGYGGRFLWSRAGSDPHLIPMLQDALALLGEEEDRLRVRLLSRLACALRSSPDRERSDALSEQAVELARLMGDHSTLAYALVGRFWASYWPENPHDRLEIANEALRVAEGVNDGERIFDARMTRCMVLMDLGATSDAWAELNLMIRGADRLRQPAHLWATAPFSASFALMQGEFDRMEELIERESGSGELISDHASGVDPVAGRASAPRIHRFLLRREQGRLGEVEGLVRASIEEFPWYPLHRAALACLLLELGRDGEARAVFDELARGDFRALYRDNEWLFGMALAGDACSMLGDARAAAILYEQLHPFAGRHVVAQSEGSLGAVDRYLGRLAMTLDRFDEAERHFEDAIALNERMGARPWTAHARHDLARLLLSRDAPGDGQRAEALLREVHSTARDIGMVALEERIGELLDEAPAPSPSAAGRAQRNVFRREGEYFSITFEGDAFRLRDVKGLRYLARLLATPGRESHPLDLVATASGHPPAPPRPRPEGLEERLPTDAGEILDAKARAAYERRLQELGDDLEEAESWGDADRAARARAEREFLARELANAVGLGGRGRRGASPAERARQSVTKAIKAAIAKIAKESPSLGRHLSSTIRTGNFCRYEPDPRAPISWTV